MQQNLMNNNDYKESQNANTEEKSIVFDNDACYTFLSWYGEEIKICIPSRYHIHNPINEKNAEKNEKNSFTELVHEANNLLKLIRNQFPIYLSERNLKIIKFICKLDTDAQILPINIVLSILYIHDDWPCILYPIVKNLLFAESRKKFIHIVQNDFPNIINKYVKNDKNKEYKIIQQLKHYIEQIFIPLIKEKSISESTNETIEQTLSHVNNEKFGSSILQYCISIYENICINLIREHDMKIKDINDRFLRRLEKCCDILKKYYHV